MAFAQDDLEALRHQFGASDGGTMATPEYRRIAEKIFSEGGRRPAPYAGMPTLLDAPARTLSEDAAELAGLQVAAYRWILPLQTATAHASDHAPCEL